MIEQHIRPLYQKIFVDPLVRKMGNRITPNMVTSFSAITGLLILPAVLMNQTVLAIFLLIFSGYLDTLDGSLARLQNKSSNWGSVLDIMSDRLVEFTVVLAIFLQNPAERGLDSLLICGSMLLCITSFLVVGIFSQNCSEKSFYYSPGFIERAEAFIFFIFMLIWPAYFHLLAILFVFSVSLTAVIRLIEFYQHSEKNRNVPL